MRTCRSSNEWKLKLVEEWLSYVQKVLCQYDFNGLPDGALLELVPLNSVRRLRSGSQWLLPVVSTTAGALRTHGRPCLITDAEMAAGITSSVWIGRQAQAEADLKEEEVRSGTVEEQEDKPLVSDSSVSDSAAGDSAAGDWRDFQCTLALCRERNVFAHDAALEGVLRAYWSKHCRRPSVFWKSLVRLGHRHCGQLSRRRVAWYHDSISLFRTSAHALVVKDITLGGHFDSTLGPGDVLIALQRHQFARGLPIHRDAMRLAALNHHQASHLIHRPPHLIHHTIDNHHAFDKNTLYQDGWGTTTPSDRPWPTEELDLASPVNLLPDAQPYQLPGAMLPGAMLPGALPCSLAPCRITSLAPCTGVPCRGRSNLFPSPIQARRCSGTCPTRLQSKTPPQGSKVHAFLLLNHQSRWPPFYGTVLGTSPDRTEYHRRCCRCFPPVLGTSTIRTLDRYRCPPWVRGTSTDHTLDRCSCSPSLSKSLPLDRSRRPTPWFPSWFRRPAFHGRSRRIWGYRWGSSV
ncbi:hypothetical protein GNI_145860 [Gregarina niphandrodes]|uniref:Uncharacterized protein n=1 Tax=Gregarina niphandrodes TaxID=110365 RepID=A0A023AZU6_GRENI|nr:hypothetical protein GNI_145860 [Gregarina niphandrodes]EZG44587.1 hypothetical protein GNI_145860 [Gregarina niphandrodes]|eukprot:XP_011134153.1 hypothetical protein GNI_145860 [Gregarina niphandrodes]